MKIGIAVGQKGEAMSREILIYFDEDGKAKAYDDTYDITIHCESQEEQDEVRRLLQNVPHWIPCEKKMPKVGEDVLISVAGMYSAEGCLKDDGNWAQFRWDAIQRKDMVGAWMKMPEPYGG